CMDDDHTPAHSRIVRTCPRATPAIARSTRKLNWTAGIEAGTPRSMVVVGGVEPSTVPAKISYAVAVARSDDGENFETILTLRNDEFGTPSLERPALVRTPDGTWRLYVSCATKGTK